MTTPIDSTSPVARARTWTAVAVVLAVGAGGCAGLDTVYRGLYGALQIREDLVTPPAAYRPWERRPDYDEYQADRLRRQSRAD